jgi:hypothetical protein
MGNIDLAWSKYLPKKRYLPRKRIGILLCDDGKSRVVVLDDEGCYVGEHWRAAKIENDPKGENPNAQKMDIGTAKCKPPGEKTKTGLVMDEKKSSGGISSSCHPSQCWKPKRACPRTSKRCRCKERPTEGKKRKLST